MKNTRKNLLIILLAITSLLMMTGCESSTENVSRESSGNELEVHFIDVGQGDSSLIVFPDGKTALIDGGGRAESEKLYSYIADQKIDKIDFLIATHPHEDHIGGLVGIVDNFEIGKVYMPNRTANTKVFETLLNSIKEKGLKITPAKGQLEIYRSDDIEFTILGPLKDSYDDTNNHSVVNKLRYKDTSIIFTGDIEKEAELDLIESGAELDIDVLKVAHHGSSSSSSEEFLDSASPDYAVIQLGADNSYGHPHKETIEKLNDRQIAVLRNDKEGDIVLLSDGTDVSFYSTKDSKKRNESEAVENSENFIGNKNSKVYHSSSCSGLPDSQNRIYFESEAEAESNGFRPDSRCIE